MIITASSDSSSMRMKVLGQGDPLTVTERPWARALATNAPIFVDSSFVHKEDEIDETADDEATGSFS